MATQQDGQDPADLSRSDMALVRQAVTNGWKVPDAIRTRILKRLIEYIDTETEAGLLAEPRVVIAAARTVVVADIQQQKLDLAREKHEGKHKPDADARPRIIIPGSPASQGRSEIEGSPGNGDTSP